ncbi:unnamed protein product, partial [Fusarium fujikuroi]
RQRTYYSKFPLNPIKGQLNDDLQSLFDQAYRNREASLTDPSQPARTYEKVPLVAYLYWLRLDNKCPVDVGKRFKTCCHYPRYRALRDAEVMCRRPLYAALTDDIQEDY